MAVVKGTKDNKGNAGMAETRTWVQAHGLGSRPPKGADSIINAVHKANTADTTPDMRNTFSTHLKNMFKKGK